jgi:hypothetical protein
VITGPDPSHLPHCGWQIPSSLCSTPPAACDGPST